MVIPVAPDSVAHVDPQDYPRLAIHRWRLDGGGYAQRHDRTTRGRSVSMHREVLGPDCEGLEVDHINRNKLDNRRANLRTATRRENQQNVAAIGGTSRYRGVVRRGGRWIAVVQLDGKQNYLGTFDSERAAALAANDFRAEHMPFAVSDPALEGAA